MSSAWGNNIKISVFGESHGNGIGIVIDGLPSGEKIDMDKLLIQMARRAPGKDKTATPRKESDTPEILSGMLNGFTTGVALTAVIRNTNTRSQDYGNLLTKPRPSHADYTGFVRYKGFNDQRGGGHFSGRLTAPIVFAGALCRQILERKGIKISAHINSIGNIKDDGFNPLEIDSELMDRLSLSAFSLINQSVEVSMRNIIEECRLNQDSIGGTIECAVTGMPVGVGSPMFDGVENVISSIIFGVPAVKGIEFGAGFDISKMKGSEANDPYTYKDNRVVTTKNNNGGILGGITSGMPIIFRVAIKPTASISQEQDTIDLSTKSDTKLSIVGRHDPCIVPRAVPVIESAVAIAIMELMMGANLI